jgi:hypothetical protein
VDVTAHQFRLDLAEIARTAGQQRQRCDRGERIGQRDFPGRMSIAAISMRPDESGNPLLPDFRLRGNERGASAIQSSANLF